MKLKALFYNLFIAFFIGMSLQVSAGVNMYVAAGSVFGSGLTYYTIKHYVAPSANFGGLVMEGLQVELWQSTIEEEIFKNNEFINHSVNVDDNVVGGVAIHIPQSGGSGEVIKNPTQFPLTVRQRTDTDVVYMMDQYVTKPTRIALKDGDELSYDKRASVMREDLNKANQTVAENMMHNWITTPAYGAYSATVIPASRILSTTGADGVDNAEGDVAAGARKEAQLKDLQRMRRLFVTEDRWFPGRMCALLTPTMMIELFPADSVVTATYMQSVTEEERRNGVMYKVQGWKIMERSSVLTVAAGGSVKSLGEAGAVDDDSASLFWYDGAVEAGKRSPQVLEDLRSPYYVGDVMNFETRAGGRARRADYKGIGLLKQAKTA